ncbi:MAG TPA: TetR/AcrR family transcriptional regulator [Caulobacter sp.]|nr:TetR/AcrR family transcriptional regulator [Caulobacter sp.]
MTAAVRPTRRGRPNAVDAAQLREHIVEIARAMFYGQGYEETTMDAVAHRAAISKGTLYARFASKADLFRAVVEAQVERWSKEATRTAPTPPGTPLVTALRLYGLSILTVACSEEARALERLVAGGAEQFPELAAQVDAVGFGHGVGLISALLQREAEPQASLADPDQAAKIFIAMIMGWPRGGGVVDDQAGRGLYVEKAVSIFMQGRAQW